MLRERIEDCDGLVSLLTDRIDGPLLDAAPKLKVVSNFAVGFNNIDVKACTEQILESGCATTASILEGITQECGKDDGNLVATEKVWIVEGNVWDACASAQVVVEFPELLLVVISVACDGQCDGCGLGSSSGSSSALLIVRYGWRDIGTDDRFEVAQVDSHLHRRCAAQQV